MIFDTHAHYDDEAFDEDRDQLLSSMKDGGVGCIVNVCASVGGFGGTLELMKATYHSLLRLDLRKFQTKLGTWIRLEKHFPMPLLVRCISMQDMVE